MLIQNKDYIFKQDKKTYRLRKDSLKNGWYLTKTYDNQLESLLYTEEQMNGLLSEHFEEIQ